MKNRRAVTRRLSLFLIITVFCACCVSSSAWADGVVVHDVAYKKYPPIPQQRAIVRYRDGIETLVIESTFEGQGSRFGWIVPVPAVPTSFKEVSPGVIKTLALVLQPEITHDPFSDWLLPLLAVVAVALAFWLALVVFRHGRPGWGVSVLYWAFWLPVIALVSFPLWAGHRGAKISASTAGVYVEGTTTVGNYDVAVLRVTDPASLDKWLDENQFMQLTAQAKPIVQKYVAEGWRFVAAKMKTQNEAAARKLTPHPIAIEFPAKQAVYPMRLTALSGCDLHLELFVISDQTATTPLHELQTELCDSFSFQPAEPRFVLEPGKEYVPHDTHPPDWKGYFKGVTYTRQLLMHPNMPDWLWNGCIVTRLTGVLPPSRMTEDIPIGFRPYRPYRQHLYTGQGAWLTALRAGLIALIVTLIVSSIAYMVVARSAAARKVVVKFVVLPAIAVPVLLVASLYLFLPRAQVTIISGKEAQRRYLVAYSGYPNDYMRKLGSELVGKSPEEIAAALEVYYSQSENSRFFKKPSPPRNEDSPGNFVVYEYQGKPILRFFDSKGQPIDYDLSWLIKKQPEKPADDNTEIP